MKGKRPTAFSDLTQTAREIKWLKEAGAEGLMSPTDTDSNDVLLFHSVHDPTMSLGISWGLLVKAG